MKINILFLLGLAVNAQEKPKVITLQEAVEELLGVTTSTQTIKPGTQLLKKGQFAISVRLRTL